MTTDPETAQRIHDAAQKLAAEAPPLTAEQRHKLRAILRPPIKHDARNRGRK